MNDNKDLHQTKFRTDFLVPTPSFLTGVGTVFNIWGQYFDYNTSPSEEEADTRALLCDWGMVGQELEDAMKTLAPKGG